MALPVLLILFILIPILYYRYRDTGKGKKALTGVRVAFIAMCALLVSLPFVGASFEHSKLLYIPKKCIYTVGVFSASLDIGEMLPKHLPSDCREYKLKTQLNAPAQDYHPSLYLMFYTDKATMEQYEKNFNALSNVTEVSAECKKREFYSLDNTTFYYPKNFPDHAFSWLDDVHRKDFVDMPNAKLYIAGTYYTKGCLLDYDSGLVVYWT